MGFGGAALGPGRAALRDAGCDPAPVPRVPAASTEMDRTAGEAWLESQEGVTLCYQAQAGGTCLL